MLFSINFELRGRIAGEIERHREQMIRLGNELGLLHPEVQQCSRQLDELLLRYYEVDLRIKSEAEAS